MSQAMMKKFGILVSAFVGVNLIILLLTDAAAGMMPIWLGILAVAILMMFNLVYRILWKNKLIRYMMILIILFFVLVESLIIYHGHFVESDQSADILIVLGARIYGDTPSLTLRERLDVTAAYLFEHENAQAILSGGMGPGEYMTEAVAMQRYLMNKGIEKSRLFLEEQATSTFENLTYSFEIIDENFTEAKVMVVTSHFHLLRSKWLAEQLGKDVNGLGSDIMTGLAPNYYLREFFALIKDIIAIIFN